MSETTSALHPAPSSPGQGLPWRWRRFKIQLLHWEYWPVYIFNIPVVIIWLIHALRSRDLFFFTAANPGIETGGFFGESKSGIMSLIPESYRTVSILWEAPVREEEVEDLFRKSGLSFPVVVKPEIGERGWLIRKIDDMGELKAYIQRLTIDLILQPFIDYPLEVSIMAYRMPDSQEARITSICEKEFLHVRGDGRSTVEQLILANDRSFLHYDKLKKVSGKRFHEVLNEGEYVLLEPIGNHCRGTKFINRNDRIDKSITDTLGKILGAMDGVYYGRFDMKIRSWDSLKAGHGIRVLEFNGASSDPAHIYDPEYPLWRAYRDIFFHWKLMSKIARINRSAGNTPVTLKKIITDLIIYFRYKRTNT